MAVRKMSKYRNFIFGIATGMVILLFSYVCFQYLIPALDRTRKEWFDETVAYYCHLQNITFIHPTSRQSGSILPDDLIIPPGSYEIDGNTYDMGRDGLYRFITKEGRQLQRIVYGMGKDKDSIVTLMSSFAWICVHTNESSDTKLSDIKKTEKALSDKLYMACGSVSQWVRYCLERYTHIEHRCVACITLDSWNKYDNGHTSMEIKLDGRWILVDIANNSMFEDENGWMSIYALCEANMQGREYHIYKLATDAPVDTNAYRDASPKDFAFSFYADTIAGENNLRQWYHRVMQVPLIFVDGEYFYYPINELTSKDNNKYRLTKLMYYLGIGEEDFLKKFYGTN